MKNRRLSVFVSMPASSQELFNQCRVGIAANENSIIL